MDRTAGQHSFDELWDSAKSNIFRLELLDKYDVEEERYPLQQFRGGIFLESEEMKLWRERVAATKKRAVKVQRVHIVNLPLSDYLIFEIEGYKRTQKAGEEIFLLAQEEVSISEKISDFWMFDDQAAVELEYSKSGTYISTHGVPSEKISELVEVKHKLLQRAVPLKEFIIQNNL
ncbi:MAG: DUF6879 family protein [Candidatus Micrarchaeales archaeon]